MIPDCMVLIGGITCYIEEIDDQVSLSLTIVKPFCHYHVARQRHGGERAGVGWGVRWCAEALRTKRGKHRASGTRDSPSLTLSHSHSEIGRAHV